MSDIKKMNTIRFEKAVVFTKAIYNDEQETFTLISDENQKVSFSSVHDNDCCEYVVADVEQMGNYKTDLLREEIYGISVTKVKGIGVIVTFFITFYNPVKVLVPCYNIQNGYYSDDLVLKVVANEKIYEYDITECAECQEG